MLAFERKPIPTTTTSLISESIAKPSTPERLPELIFLDQAEATWPRHAAEQLYKIMALKDGWDGYQAGQIRRDVVEYVQDLLSKIMRNHTPAPYVTPMSNEGVMLEWHQHGIDLEIEIEKPGTLWVSFEDSVDGVEYEHQISSDFSDLARFIELLTKRAA